MLHQNYTRAYIKNRVDIVMDARGRDATLEDIADSILKTQGLLGKIFQSSIQTKDEQC